MLKTALILAGGLGTRLRPLTNYIPKPLLKIQGKPILQHIVENLVKCGVTNIIISTGYLTGEIERYFEDGNKFGAKITYSIEKEPLGTGGAIKLAAKQLQQPFFLLWGDNLMNLNCQELYNKYQEEKNPLTMVLTPREDVEHFGVAKLEDNKIISFIEKPKREEAPSNLINAGAFILDPTILEMLPEGKSSIEKDCFEKIAPQGKISAYIHDGQWFPTDTLEKYEKADKEFRSFLPNPKIFKAYDIRGEWGKDWDGEFVYKIGRALALHFKPKTVSIGRDMRESGEIIFHQLSKAFNDEGVKVIDLGLCGTELSYFSTSFLPNIDLGIIITASHNPGKDNGLKVTLRNSITIGLDSGLDKIRDLALNLPPLKNKETGITEKINIWEKYQKHVFNLVNLDLNLVKDKKIIVDAGNGIGSYLFDKVLTELNIIKMFWEPDGTFPNHLADPFQEKNTEQLKEKVIEEQADLGIAYDGDSDRVFFIDEKGRYLPGYYLATLFIDYILSKKENSEKENIVYDPRYYLAIKDIVDKYNSTAIPSKVGHTLIKQKMRENNSCFCAECSGHIYYQENNFAESSMVTTLMMLKLISEKGPLSKLVNYYFEKYPISGEINFTVENKQEILTKLKEKYNQGKINTIDGISVSFPDWRFNIRCSNTQPLLRMNIEATNHDLIKEKIEELKKIIGGKIANH